MILKGRTKRRLSGALIATVCVFVVIVVAASALSTGQAYGCNPICRFFSWF